MGKGKGKGRGKGKGKKKNVEYMRTQRDISSTTQVIGFLDVDAFEVQMWQKDYPHTRGLPCIVATNSGRIVSVSHEAKKFGINRSDTPTVREAKKKLPTLHVFRKPDKFGKQDQSKCRLGTFQIVTSILDYLNKFTVAPVTMEVASSDEIYLDLSAEVTRGMGERKRLSAKKFLNGSCYRGTIGIPSTMVWERVTEKKVGPFRYRLPTIPTASHNGMMENQIPYTYKNQERLMFGGLFMDQLCAHVEKQTQLKSSAGVSKNKLMAKVACSLNKPGRVTVLGNEAYHRTLKEVKVDSIPGLGGVIGQKLKTEFNIETVAEVFGVNFPKLHEEFGNLYAQSICSWASGRDVDPVVSKITKDQIKINKPADAIKTPKRLRTVIRGLISEMQIILEEQATRYFRKTSNVRVDFSIGEGTESFSNTFVISPKAYEEILKYIESITCPEEGDPKECVITSLTFVLKDFISWVKIFPGFTKLEPDAVNGGVTNLLKLETKPSEVDLKFEHVVVDKFRINRKLKFSSYKPILPTLLSETDLQSLVGYNLLQKFNHKKTTDMISDYTYYDNRKHSCFSKWLTRYRLQVEGGLDDVQFISFQGRIIRSLKTLFNLTYGEWDTYAMNVNGVIYLWDEKDSRREGQVFRHASQYMGCMFENLAGGKAKDGTPQDIEKVFVVQKVGFGTHKLLLLSNVDAADSFGNHVQVTLGLDPVHFKRQNTSLMTEKKLKIWSQAVISGSPTVILGTRDREKSVKSRNPRSMITKVVTCDTEEFRAQVLTEEQVKQCYHFQDRLLNFIKNHLPVHDKKLVKKFSWCPGKQNVVVSIVPEGEVKRLLVPSIYFNN